MRLRVATRRTLASNDTSLRFALCEYNPSSPAAVKGYPKVESATVSSTFMEITLEIPALRMYEKYNF